MNANFTCDVSDNFYLTFVTYILTNEKLSDINRTCFDKFFDKL